MRRVFIYLVSFVLIAAAVQAQDKPIPPAEAAARMQVPPGFRVTLFAGEPDVVQPIAFTLDSRGRLWVVESFSYPKWVSTPEGKDRIVILEDTDGDGRLDKRTVFYDKGANLSGITLGFGGVWLAATPNLLFIPDRDNNDVPDGPPQVILDGWSLQARHNVFNSLTWGPDGWLYGCNGILATSKLGAPGTPEDKRTPMNCGVWRYHPTRKTFEVVANGTTNPWGLDFDDRGEMFITNCVIEHLWHVIPGAHYKRMYGQDFNPHLYELMPTCADHIHWGGGHWTESRGGKGSHDAPGGGHAHAGCMVYLGDNWPMEYRNGVFTCNIHGNRINYDTLTRRDSGYVARHAPDFLLANDPMSRGLGLAYGPDGGVFFSDWYDTGECHNYEVVHVSGRLYKVTHGTPKPWKGDLARLSDAELVELLLHRNDFQVRHARRLLQERAVAGTLSDVRPALTRLLQEHPDGLRRLRALWALHGIAALDEEAYLRLMDSPHEEIRAWALRLSLDHAQPSSALITRLKTLASGEKSPLVRLHLTSVVQRVPLAQRWEICEEILKRDLETRDLSLALMTWYAIEPLAEAQIGRFGSFLGITKHPLIREHIARRLAGLSTGEPVLVARLQQEAESARCVELLRGWQAARAGERSLPTPKDWAGLYARLKTNSTAEVRDRATFLAVQFNDETALSDLKKTLADPSAPLATRMAALSALLTGKRPELVPQLHQLLDDAPLRGQALRGLASFEDPSTPQRILERYAALTETERADAVQTLASRPSWAVALLDAMEKGRVPRRDLSAYTVRQMQALKDKTVATRVTAVWGALRPASRERAELTARYKALLTPRSLKDANVSNGRAVYARTCASCHVLFGEGGKVGPDLTGSQRSNLDYLLENILDPSAVVPRDYQVSELELKDGRLVSGIIKEESTRIVTVQLPNEVLRIPVGEIDTRRLSPVSMMPDGLFSNLKQEEVRDLIAYLASSVQAPLPRPGATPPR